MMRKHSEYLSIARWAFNFCLEMSFRPILSEQPSESDTAVPSLWSSSLLIMSMVSRSCGRSVEEDNRAKNEIDLVVLSAVQIKNDIEFLIIPLRSLHDENGPGLNWNTTFAQGSSMVICNWFSQLETTWHRTFLHVVWAKFDVDLWKYQSLCYFRSQKIFKEPLSSGSS